MARSTTVAAGARGQALGQDPRDCLAVRGRLTGRTVAPVRDLVLYSFPPGQGWAFRLDLSAVDRIDAAGVGLVVGLHRRAQVSGGELVVVVSAPVARALRSMRLDRVVTLELALPRQGTEPDLGGAQHTSAAAVGPAGSNDTTD